MVIETDFAFNLSALFEPLSRVFEYDVCVMVRPDNTVQPSRQRNKETRIGQLLHSGLDHLSNLDVGHLEKFLLDDGRLHGKLEDSVETKVACYSSWVHRVDFPWACRRDGRDVIIGNLRNLRHESS